VIAFYDAKYTHHFWRPVTAVRSDGVQADTNWTPLATTALDPSYPGAHAVVSAAAADILATFFHHDRDRFAVTSEVLPGVERSFTSFSAAADEASASRIYAGQHFRFDEVAGERLGRHVADYVLQNFLAAPRDR
jgi:PAP2 superfamily